MSRTWQGACRGILYLYATLTFVAALIPAGSVTDSVPDKWLHGMAYFVLTVLLLASGFPRPGSVVGAAVLAIIHGAAVEAVQSAVPWRHAEWGDLAADGAGILAAVGVWSALSLRVRSNRDGPTGDSGPSRERGGA